jgi:hypothetical protein
MLSAALPGETERSQYHSRISLQALFEKFL